MEAILTTRDLDQVPEDRVLRGRVLGSDGQPIAGAVLSPSFFTTAAHSGFKPGIFDPLAITDESGSFAIVASSPIQMVRLRVEARGFATRITPDLARDPDGVTIPLNRGVSVRGKVRQAGQAVPGISLGLCQMDRSESFVGAYTIGAGPDGDFLFSNVPANDRFVLYGIMDSLKERGALPITPLETGAVDSVIDVGILEIGPAHTLSGKVILSDGKPVPPKTRIGIYSQDAWDHQTLELGENGEFQAEGLPSDLYSISLTIRGYRLSPDNISKGSLNPRSLVGRIDQSTRVLIRFDPGKDPEREPGRDWRWEMSLHELLENHPLTGAPQADDGGSPLNPSSELALFRQIVFTPGKVDLPATDEEAAEIQAERQRLRFQLAKDLGRKSYGVAWRPAGMELGLLEFQKPVQILDASLVPTGTTIGTAATDFAFDPLGRYVAHNGNREVQIIDQKTGTSLALPAQRDQASMAFSPDGQTIATADYGMEAHLWQVATGQRIRSFRVAGREGALTPVFSPDGVLLAVGNRNDRTHVFNVATGETVHVLDRRMSQGLSFSPDGKRLAIGYADGLLGVWEVATGKLERLRRGRVEEIFAVAWSPQGDLLATSGLNGPVVIWSARHLAVLHELDAGSERTFSLAFAPDGKVLAAAGNETTRLWRMDREGSP
jgi:WD40 repeat protein